MAEEDTKTVDSGFVPGRALSQEEYTFGRPDFYKDYLSLSGINVRKPKDDDDDDDDTDDYVAPQVVPTEGGESEPTNLLSTQLATGLRGNVTGVVGNYYDAKVKAADLQSMDLSSKSWQDYKKTKGLGDKSNLTRDANITGVGLAVAGTSGAMIGGALLGEGVQAPWGIVNEGAGMFRAIGNYAVSEQYNATKEVVAAQAAFAEAGNPEIASKMFGGQDMGNAFYVDDTYLVRRPGSTQYIGTLPSGLTNQQVLNLEAIKNNKLPKLNGIGDEDGFGVGGTGGYKFNGFFVDANGQTSYYGPLAGIEQLAKKDFNGDKKKAEQWLTEVRSFRNIFGSTITKEQAQAIKDRINGESDDITTTTTGGKPFGADQDRFGRGVTKSGAMSGETGFTNIIDPGRGGSTEFRDTDIRDPGRGGTTEFADTDIIDPGRGSDREFTDRTPDPRFDPRFGDFGQATTFSDRNRGIRDALTSSYDKARRDSADRKAAQTYSFSEDDYRDMSEGSQTADEVTVDPTGGQDLSATFADDAASSDTGGGKIVCTMMNQSYGFGSFRNAIWLKYSKDNLSEEYQKGYHRIFLPLVAYAKGTGVSNKIVRNTLEHIAKHRTLDLRQEMRGAKRHTLGRLYRSVLEPICYIVGKV
jgi:hypothetical protein